MARQISDSLFVASRNETSGGVAKYTRKSAKELALKEQDWFQPMIAANPDLVINPCRSAGIVDEDEEWYFWDREYRNIDVLLLSNYGRIGIVEVKPSYSSEIRRKVLAQILDYAVNLRDERLDKLPSLPKDKQGNFVTETQYVEQHLADGDFLLIIAGDEMDDRAVKLSEALLGDHIVNPWDLVTLDLALFEDDKQKDDILIVPYLRKAVIHSTRHVVKVKVYSEGQTRVSMERQAPIAATKVPKETDPRMQDVFQLFEERAPDGYVFGSSTPNTYLFFFPEDQKASVHYEFLDRRNGQIGIEIHIEADDEVHKTPLLQGFAEELQNDFSRQKVVFHKNKSSDRSQLRILYGPDATPDVIVEGMLLLIQRTQSRLWE